MSLTPTNKFCIALIATDFYFKPLILTLYTILKQELRDIDIVILIDHTISKEKIDYLKTFNNCIKLYNIDSNKFKSLDFGSQWRTWTYNCGYRFEIFSLVEYEKVFYIDIDIILRSSITEIFNLNHELGFCRSSIGTIPEFKNFKAFNAGVCILGKKYLNTNITKELIRISAEKKYSSDEAALFAFFGNNFEELDHTYNMLSTSITNKDIYNTSKIIHFIGSKKPWNKTLADSFDEHIMQNIGISNCYYLFRQFKNYENNIIAELTKNGNCKFILG